MSMANFSKECIEVFLDKQLQLFDEKVAETPQQKSFWRIIWRWFSTAWKMCVTIWMKAEWMRYSSQKMRFCRHPKCLHFQVENISLCLRRKLSGDISFILQKATAAEMSSFPIESVNASDKTSKKYIS